MFSAVPPWNCSSPAGFHTLSPDRSTTVSPSRVPTRPTPSVQTRSCPFAWWCQLVRAPGVNRTSPTVSFDVPSPLKTGFIHTSPVKLSAGVLTVVVVGFLSMSLLGSGAGSGGVEAQGGRARLLGRDVLNRAGRPSVLGPVGLVERVVQARLVP